MHFCLTDYLICLVIKVRLYKLGMTFARHSRLRSQVAQVLMDISSQYKVPYFFISKYHTLILILWALLFLFLMPASSY